MMKNNIFDENWKDVYRRCFRSFAGNCFIATIPLNKNICHVIIIKLKMKYNREKTLSIGCNNGKLHLMEYSCP